MQPENFKETGSFRKTRFILLSSIIFILIVFLFWAQTAWIFFVIVFMIVIVFSTMLFWQHYAAPDLDLFEQLFLTKNILINLFTRSPLFLTIKNGVIEGDYLLLKNKPEINVLNIDHKSAVLIEGNSNQRSLLLNGVHINIKKSKLIGVFNIGIRHIHLGPCAESDLGTKHSNESLAEFHLRKELVERTKTRLNSGDLIYPSFAIFYRLEPSGQEKKDSMLFQSICEKIRNDGSELVSSEMMDDFIISQLIEGWSAFCGDKNLDEILSNIPVSYELPLLTEFGIRYQITLEQIF